MCGRYDYHINAQTVIERFQLKLDPGDLLRPNVNVCPTQTMPIITNSEPHRMTPARWGLVPSWAKDLKIGAKMINARAETLAEKPAFRVALAKRRCLVPASAFYEWRTGPTGKIPLRFAPLNGEDFAFAGLWEVWKEPDRDDWLKTYTIITTEANEMVEQAHDRMPVILPREAETAWLAVGDVPAVEALTLLKPYPAAEMAYTEVPPELLGGRQQVPNSA